MSVYIKGMEMPTSCGECELCACYVFEDGTEEYYRCPITMYPIHDFDERHEHCPLVPVPDHGRLIDADALIIALETQDYSCAPDTLEEWTPMDMTKAEIADISNAQTVIPSDKDGAE